MAREKSVLVQYKLRIHEDLRRAIETAAKEKGVSSNYEMASRLQHSFNSTTAFSMSGIANDLEINWYRWAEFLHRMERQNQILDAALALVQATEKPPGKEREQAIAITAGKVKAEARVAELEAASAMRRQRATGGSKS